MTPKVKSSENSHWVCASFVNMSAKRGPKVKLTDSARKKTQKDANAKLNKSRIYIGDQIDRWLDLRTRLSIESNANLAKILLDR